MSSTNKNQYYYIKNQRSSPISLSSPVTQDKVVKHAIQKNGYISTLHITPSAGIETPTHNINSKNLARASGTLNPTNVYLCQFPTYWTKDDLRPLVEPFGPISEIRVQTPRDSVQRFDVNSTSTDLFHGLAFVHYRSPESASTAVAALNGATPIGIGHRIVARLATRSKNVSSNCGLFSDMRLFTVHINTLSGPRDHFFMFSKTQCVISDVPQGWTETLLYERFSVFGRVARVELAGNCALVSFDAPESCLRAVAHASDCYSLRSAWRELGSSFGMDVPHIKGPNICFALVPQTKYVPFLNKKNIADLENLRNIYTSAFPNNWGPNELATLFGRYGKIRDINVTTKATEMLRSNRGTAFIHYFDELSAICAVACIHDTVPKGSSDRIFVTFAKVNMGLIFDKLMVLKKGKGYYANRCESEFSDRRRER